MNHLLKCIFFELINLYQYHSDLIKGRQLINLFCPHATNVSLKVSCTFRLTVEHKISYNFWYWVFSLLFTDDYALISSCTWLICDSISLSISYSIWSSLAAFIIELNDAYCWSFLYFKLKMSNSYFSIIFSFLSNSRIKF